VIGLPSALFYGTGIPASILIINKNKPKARKGKVLFINAELEYEEGKNQNRLRDKDINHIVSTFDNYQRRSNATHTSPLLRRSKKTISTLISEGMLTLHHLQRFLM
jgi:type I restriction enzyme M protein